MSSRQAGLNRGSSGTAGVIVAGAIAMLGWGAAPAGAQASWIEATGPHVTVVSDAGDRRARDIAWQFEQVREAVSQTFPWVRVDPWVPLVVLATRNEASMRALAPQHWESGDGRRCGRQRRSPWWGSGEAGQRADRAVTADGCASHGPDGHRSARTLAGARASDA